jgi:hypothetical protein
MVRFISENTLLLFLLKDLHHLKFVNNFFHSHVILEQVFNPSLNSIRLRYLFRCLTVIVE